MRSRPILLLPARATSDAPPAQQHRPPNPQHRDRPPPLRAATRSCRRSLWRPHRDSRPELHIAPGNAVPATPHRSWGRARFRFENTHHSYCNRRLASLTTNPHQPHHQQTVRPAAISSSTIRCHRAAAPVSVPATASQYRRTEQCESQQRMTESTGAIARATHCRPPHRSPQIRDPCAHFPLDNRTRRIPISTQPARRQCHQGGRPAGKMRRVQPDVPKRSRRQDAHVPGPASAVQSDNCPDIPRPIRPRHGRRRCPRESARPAGATHSCSSCSPCGC